MMQLQCKVLGPESTELADKFDTFKAQFIIIIIIYLLQIVIDNSSQ